MKQQISPSELSDDALIRQIVAGRYEWFPVLSARYLPLIRSIAAKVAVNAADAEDLVQEGLLALYGAVQAYQAEKAAFSTFAAVCVRRAVTDALRSAGCKHRIPQALVTSIADQPELAGVHSAEAEYLQRESLRSFAERIKCSLSPLEYRVLVNFLAGKSYAQIAAVTGIGEKSVNNALYRVRKKLRTLSVD